MKNHIKYLLLILLFLNSCIENSKTKKVSNNNKIEKCELMISFDSYLNSVRKGTFKPQDYDDNCVLKFVEKLSDMSVKFPKYLDDLDKISKISDGYLSEYFIDILIFQFYNNFDKLTEYLFLNKNSTLNNFLIEGLSMEVSDKGSEERNRIKKYINQKIKSKSNEEYITFIKELEMKVDPSIFD